MRRGDDVRRIRRKSGSQTGVNRLVNKNVEIKEEVTPEKTVSQPDKVTSGTWESDLPLAGLGSGLDTAQKDYLEINPVTSGPTHVIEEIESEAGYKEKGDTKTILDIATGQQDDIVDRDAGKVIKGMGKRMYEFLSKEYPMRY